MAASSVARQAAGEADRAAAVDPAVADSGSRGEGAELERARTQVGDGISGGDTQCRNADGRDRGWARRAAGWRLIRRRRRVRSFSSPLRGPRRITRVVQCAPGSQGYTDAAWTPFGSTGFSIWGTNECGRVGYGLRLDTHYGMPGHRLDRQRLRSRLALHAPPQRDCFASAGASLHYGDNGGFAAAYFSDGAPGFAVPDGGGGAPSLFTTATTSNAHIFEVRLQCFAYSQLSQRLVLRLGDELRLPRFATSRRRLFQPAGGTARAATWSEGVKGLQADGCRCRWGSPHDRRLRQRRRLKERGLLPPDYQGIYYTHLKPCPSSLHPAVCDRHREGSRLGERPERRRTSAPPTSGATAPLRAAGRSPSTTLVRVRRDHRARLWMLGPMSRKVQRPCRDHLQ